MTVDGGERMMNRLMKGDFHGPSFDFAREAVLAGLSSSTDPKILLKCPRCFITFDPADTIVTWEEILEPGKEPAKKRITRGSIRMDSTSDGMEYTCGVCGNRWAGKDPGPLDTSDFNRSPDEPDIIFHEGHDHPIGAVSHHYSE